MRPDRERLRQLKEALLLGDPIDDRLRIELVGYLELLGSIIPAPRGRPVNSQLRQRAGIVGVLHVTHGMKLELALNVAAVGATEDERARDRKSLRDAYMKLKRTGERVPVPERLVIAALARCAKSP